VPSRDDEMSALCSQWWHVRDQNALFQMIRAARSDRGIHDHSWGFSELRNDRATGRGFADARIVAIQGCSEHRTAGEIR
jgi:hypothetical protein